MKVMSVTSIYINLGIANALRSSIYEAFMSATAFHNIYPIGHAMDGRKNGHHIPKRRKEWHSVIQAQGKWRKRTRACNY